MFNDLLTYHPSCLLYSTLGAHAVQYSRMVGGEISCVCGHSPSWFSTQGQVFLPSTPFLSSYHSKVLLFGVSIKDLGVSVLNLANAMLVLI